GGRSKFQVDPPVAANYSMCPKFWQGCAGSKSAGAASLRLDVGRFQDRRPAGDFRLYEGVELRRRALLLARHRSAEVGQTLADAGIVERLIERRGKLVGDVLRRALGGKDAGPDAHLIVDSGVLRRRDVGEDRQAFFR